MPYTPWRAKAVPKSPKAMTLLSPQAMALRVMAILKKMPPRRMPQARSDAVIRKVHI